MNTNIQKITSALKPLAYTERFMLGCVSAVKNVTKLPILAGKTTGKIVAKRGKILFDKKIKEKYEKYKNNSVYKMMGMLVWMTILLWLCNKIYHIVYLAFPLTWTKLIETPSIIGYMLFGCVVVFYFLRDLLRIISWDKQDNFRELVLFYAQTNKAEKLKKILLSQNISQKTKRELKEYFEFCTEAQEILNVYDKVVLTQMDEEAEKIIDKYASLTSIGNILSPKLSLDYLITIMAFSKMMLEIANVYRVKLSISTFFMLLAFGLSIAGLTTFIINYIKTHKNNSPKGVKENISHWLIGVFCETAAICCVMSFLGYSMQYTLRPIEPHN